MRRSKKEKKKVLQEFKDFILRGNAIDLAVGVVMGAAFHDLVDSVVEVALKPIIALFGTADKLENLSFYVAGKPVTYGIFVHSLISLVLVGFVLFFLVVKPLNKLMSLRKPEPDLKSEKMDCPECLSSVPKLAKRCAFCTAPLTGG